MLFDIIQIPIKTYNLGQSFLLCSHIPRSLELFFISLHVKIPVLVSFISKMCVCIYIYNMCFQSKMNFFPFQEKNVLFYVSALKQLSADFQSCWADGRITKYISRGRGKVFFTPCLKSDRIKESLRNASNRSFFPFVEEKSLKLKRDGSLCESYLQTVPAYLRFLFILNTLNLLKYLRILRWRAAVGSKVQYYSNYQF